GRVAGRTVECNVTTLGGRVDTCSLAIPFHMEFLLCVKHSSLLPEHGLQSSRGEHDRLSLGRLGNHLKAPRDAKLNPKNCEGQRPTTLVDEHSQTHRISLFADFHTF